MSSKLGQVLRLTEFLAERRHGFLRLTTVWLILVDNGVILIMTVVNEDILKVDLAQHIQNLKKIQPANH